MAFKKNTDFFNSLKAFITQANGNYLINQLEEAMNPIKDYLTHKIEKNYKDKEKQYQFLTKFDSIMLSSGETPSLKFYGTYSCEFIHPLYKLLNYSILPVEKGWNTPINYNNADEMTMLNSKPFEFRIARVVDSIMAQIIKYAPPKLSYVGLSEVLIEEKYTIQKLVRVTHLLKEILIKIHNKRAKYLSTLLYLLGGRLKIEVINYLRTIDSTKLKSDNMNKYVSQKEQSLLRELTKEEIECFENKLIEELKDFIISLRTNENKAIYSHKMEEMASNLMREDFIDDYDDLLKNKPEEILPIEEVHYTLLFCMDTLSFIHLMFTNLSNCKGKTIEFEQRKQIQLSQQTVFSTNHYGAQILGGFMPSLIEIICNTIIHLSDSPFAILNAWYCLKRKNIPMNKKEEEGYQRTQLYDDTGLSIFFYYVLHAGMSCQNYIKLDYSVGPYTIQHLMTMYAIVMNSLLAVEETAIQGIELFHYFLNKVSLFDECIINNEFLNAHIPLRLLSFIGQDFNEDLRLTVNADIKAYISKFPIASALIQIAQWKDKIVAHQKEWIVQYLMEVATKKVITTQNTEAIKKIVSCFLAPQTDIKECISLCISIANLVLLLNSIYKSMFDAKWLKEELIATLEKSIDKAKKDTTDTMLLNSVEIIKDRINKITASIS